MHSAFRKIFLYWIIISSLLAPQQIALSNESVDMPPIEICAYCDESGAEYERGNANYNKDGRRKMAYTERQQMERFHEELERRYADKLRAMERKLKKQANEAMVRIERQIAKRISKNIANRNLQINKEIEKKAREIEQKVNRELNKVLGELALELNTTIEGIILDIEPSIRKAYARLSGTRDEKEKKIQDSTRNLEKKAYEISLSSLLKLKTKAEESRLKTIQNFLASVESIKINFGQATTAPIKWISSKEYLAQDNVKDKIREIFKSELDEKKISLLEQANLLSKVQNPLDYQFNAPAGNFNEENKKLYEKLYHASPLHEQGIRSREIGLSAVQVADIEYTKGHVTEAQIAHQIGQEMLDITLGLIPGVSLGKDAYEAITGKSLLTGADIGSIGRSFALLGVVSLGASNYLKIPAKIALKVFKKIKIKTFSRGANFIKNGFKTATSFVSNLIKRTTDNGVDYLNRFVKANPGASAKQLNDIADSYKQLEKGIKNAPVSKFEGIIHRSVPERYINIKAPTNGLTEAEEIKEIFKWHAKMKTANGRYSIGGDLGHEAMYASIGKKEDAWQTALEELGNHANQPLRLASKEVSLEKVLDLTNLKVRKHLRISKYEIVRESKDISAYELTHQIGDLAKKYNFEAIKAPSAVDKNGINMILLRNK